MIDGRGGEEKRKDGVSSRAIAAASWKGEGERCLPLCGGAASAREQNMQLERQYTVKWSLLELMSTLSVRTLKCSLTRACSSSSNTSHRIILSPVFSSPVAGREAHLGGRRTKGSKQGFGSDRVTSRLLKLDHDRQKSAGCSGAPSRRLRHG